MQSKGQTAQRGEGIRKRQRTGFNPVGPQRVNPDMTFRTEKQHFSLDGGWNIKMKLYLWTYPPCYGYGPRQMHLRFSSLRFISSSAKTNVTKSCNFNKAPNGSARSAASPVVAAFTSASVSVTKKWLQLRLATEERTTATSASSTEERTKL